MLGRRTFQRFLAIIIINVEPSLYKPCLVGRSVARLMNAYELLSFVLHAVPALLENYLRGEAY